MKKKFGNDTDLKGKFYILREEFPIIKKEEDRLNKVISERIKFYINKKNGYNSDEKVFGVFNPLNFDLYYRISGQYLKEFISKF